MSLFEGSKHASLYARFRPTPPARLTQKVMEYLGQKLPGPYKLAVDVACGSGQSTPVLAPYFDKVIGTDVSAAQIKAAHEAQKEPTNVTYMCCEAYEQPVEDHTAELITVSQAVHWFDFERFYKEVDRILVPDGVLALFGNHIPKLTFGDDKVKSDAINALVMHMYIIDTGKYWSPKLQMVDNGYRDVFPPYTSGAERFDDSCVKFDASVDDVLGYLSTWSGFQTLCKCEGDGKGKEIMDRFQRGLMAIIGMTEKTNDCIIQITFNYFMILCRKPADNK